VQVESPVTSGGDPVAIQINTEVNTGTITVRVDGGDATTDLVLTVDDCGGCDQDGDSDSDEADNGVQITFNSADAQFDGGVIDLLLSATCEEADTLTVTVTQSLADPNDEDSDTIECVAANLTIIKETVGGTGTEEFDFEVLSDDDPNCDGVSFTLVDGDSETLACDDANATYEITETIPTGWTVAITCTDVGIPNSGIVVDNEGGTVDVTLGAGDSAICTFTNTLGGTVTPTAGAASSLTASANPNSVVCNGSSFIAITVKDGSGAAAANGTSVIVQTNLGAVNPSNTTTTNGGALVLFTAPANQGGTATITASAGTATGNTTVSVNCSAATATPPPPPPPATGGGIQPPNTGDAGLADQATLPVVLGIAIALASIIGALAVVRVRA
jgi:hypothetical protein